MQVTETSAQGLKRDYKVVVPAADLAAKLESQLEDMKGKVRINGFRPGKVPTAHMRRLYGKSIMGEVVQEAVNEANRKIVEDNKLRLAGEPKFDIVGGQTEMEQVLEAKGDLAFTVAVETLPSFDIGKFDDVTVDRFVVDVSDAEVDEAIKRMADQQRAYNDKEGDAPAIANGDRATIDFVGKIDGEPFEGGSGEGIDLVVGSKSFIPGFEEQLEGVKKDESKTISVSFPENYAAARLAGKAATFDVTVKNVAAPGELAIDDEFAKKFGFDTMEAFRAAVRSNIEADMARGARVHTKRLLLDALDGRYSFELPQGLVEQEFDGIWRSVVNEQTAAGKTFESEGTTEEKARDEYRRIAERRVRLGLVLAEVGQEAGVKVEDDEVTKALVERIRAFPGQEQALWDYYRKNPQALGEIRAPLFEEKVIDHILSQAKVTDKHVTRDELVKMDQDGVETAA
ncbi:MAG: trigger factor [Hyphomicrobiales bacterium]|nr:trigger factor [Hyphomicrobiales bacterium]